MLISSASRVLSVFAALMCFASQRGFAQEASGSSAAQPAPAATEETKLPPLDVTATTAKKKKAKVAPKASPAQPPPVSVQAAVPQPEASDGSSTQPGAVNGYVADERRI